MEIVLVQPPIGGNREDLTPPVGVLQLAAIARADGHRVRVVDQNLHVKRGLEARRTPLDQLVAAIPGDADLIGFTTWSYNFGITMEVVTALKAKRRDVRVVLGGPHATFVDEAALRTFPEVDLVLRDEGDRTFPQLLRALAFERPEEKLALIPGLSWRRGDEVVRNPHGSVVEDLDALPFPAYDMIDVKEYLSYQPTLIVEAGRGCPYNCNFCSTSNMFQRTYRVKSPKRLIDEVEWLMKLAAPNGRRFELLHDNLVANKKHVLAVCAEIRERNLDFDWSCTSRTDNLTEEVAEAMFLAGCASIFFGVETLSAERQKWTGKRLKPPLVEAAVAMTRRQHITPSVGIIVGFPEESHEEIDATVEAAVRWTTEPAIKAEVSTAALRYYPGADLYAHKDELRYDDLASADVNPVPGYRLREAWRDKVATLFPLDAIHTPRPETERNLLRRNFVRTLLKAAPHTFRACMVVLKLPAHELFDRMSAGRTFHSLEKPDRVTLWNETLLALASVVERSGSEEVLELLTCEAPFWKTQPVAPPLNRLEKATHPKKFEQEALLAFARGARAEPPPRIEGQWLLSIRCGFENVVWFTPDPDKVWRVFQDSFAKDPRGTIDFVNSLRRGL